jgi:ABC-type multidrug transport system fused ATPase/permease subunit
MEITTKQILKGLNILSWIIFIGLCVEAGSFIFNSFYTFFINPAAANNLFNRTDLSILYSHDPGYFFVITLIMSIVTVLKAIMFYLIVKILHENKLNLSQPFTADFGKFIFNLFYLALGIGCFSTGGKRCAEWLVAKGIAMPDVETLHLGGADVWLFMAVVVFVIAHVFKRGIEIQSENELTV